MYWHLPYYYSPTNFFGNHENVFPNMISMNMLCVPKERKQNVERLEPVQVPPEDATDA
jgi:hypothetical protein